MNAKKVSITASGYSPISLKINVGDVVGFTNDDTKTHSVEFDTSPTPVPVGTPTVSPGATFDVTFPDVGTFHYHSGSEPGFSGTVVVVS